MKAGIWQPYFFPYIGYFQLVNACDVFCFYNDVNFIKKGFIHRNSLLAGGEKFDFTIPLSNASQNVRINAIRTAPNFEQWKGKFLQTFRHSYANAPYYKEVVEILELSLKHEFISTIASTSVRLCAEYLDITTVLKQTSELDYNRSASAENKILSIVRVLKADHYLNTAGGKELYDEINFAQQGVELSLTKPDIESINQLLGAPVANLSILHLLCHYDVKTLQQAMLLKEI